jgi:hypothetical protein
MFLVVLVVAAALAVPLLGGRLSALADVEVRLGWVLFAALALQIASLYLPGLPRGARVAMGVASYPVAGVFVAANRRLPGVPLAALGAALNLLAIVANGGVMPASPSALHTAGLPLEVPGYRNSTAVADPRLGFLGDVFAIPASWPLSNVFSIGDVLIAVGAVWGLHRVCGSRLAGPARPRRP